MSDDLDQQIRQAASAHLALAPSSVLTTPGVAGIDDDHDLIARAMRRIDDPAYLAPLAPFDPEALMMSEHDHDPDRDRPAGGLPTSATDDSGLHDIRALAQNAKQRISRKMPTVTDADEGVWASTTGQLKAIALPEPARIVSLPDLPATPDADLAGATADRIAARGPGAAVASAASEVTPVESLRPRKRTGLWLAIGGAAAAAAVAAVVLSGGSSDKKAAGAGAASNTVAATPPLPSIEAAALTTTPTAPGATAPAGGAIAATESATGAGSAAPAIAARAADAPAPEGRRDGAGSGSGSAREPRAGSSDAAADPRAAKGPATAGTGKEPKLVVDPKATGDKGAIEKVKPTAGTGTAAAPGEKSIDDLLGDATGGGPKPPPGGGDSAPKPEKKGLDGKDIKAGMSPLAGRAQDCFDQHGVAGHVKVKATVDPSGKVIKVDALGEFAGTPTGSCVASVVKNGAKFPAWDGAPMSVNYSYTLNE